MKKTVGTAAIKYMMNLFGVSNGISTRIKHKNLALLSKLPRLPE
jgi:hypothetical protein